MASYTIWGLSMADIAIVIIYFLVIVYIAVRAARRMSNRDDYFMGGRRFGKLIQTFAAFGQATSVENVSTTTTMVNTNGASGIWAMLAGGLANLPVFWITSVWYRRLRLLTLGDFFEERYHSKKMAAFYALCQIIFFVMIAAVGFVAMSKTISAIVIKPPSELNAVEYFEYNQALERERLEAADYALLEADQRSRLEELQMLNPRKEFSFINNNRLVIAIAIFTLLYASLGGLTAAFMVDLMQGILVILLSMLLFPFAMMRINDLYGSEGIMGTFNTMHQILPESFTEIWGSPNLIEFSWFWIASFSLMIIMTTAAQANQLTACGAARDEYTARYGFVSGMLLKRYLTVMWGVLALLTLILYGGMISDPDYVWGHATRDLLGPLNIGLVGLMIASVMAALMGSLSTFMLSASALITNNLYRPFFPNRSEKHYIFVGRLFSGLYVLLSAYIATESSSLFELFKMTMMFNSILAAGFWLGMLWRKANRAGAWASMVVMFVATVILPFGMPLIPGVRTSDYLSKTTNATPVERTYRASQMDVDERIRAIANWDDQAALGIQNGERPAMLTPGDQFERTVLLPRKSIFWSEGLAVSEGNISGRGYLKVELIALDMLGWDLSQNSYSFNETLTFLFRIIFPFFVLILVAGFTKKEDKDQLDQFFGKMLTPVAGSPEDDEREMALTRANPTRLNHMKMFPESSWEFRKWNREDWIGAAVSCVAAISVVVLLVFVVNLGK